MMVVAVIFLLVNFVFVSNESHKIITESEEVIISDTAETEPEETTATVTNKRETWRFYFIDLVILGVGGGFCLVMILRQRKKTREELK
jgi:predicted transglutaminase-like protease